MAAIALKMRTQITNKQQCKLKDLRFKTATKPYN